MIIDDKNLEHNKKMLEKFIKQEKDLARVEDRKEGLVYIYAMNQRETCDECTKLFDGKVFLLYDGRTHKKYKVPKLPNPTCLIPKLYEGESECLLSWFHISPSTFYLKKEKHYIPQFDAKIEALNRKNEAERGLERQGPYFYSWNLKIRTENQEEWIQWMHANSHIELYEPPSLIDEITLSLFEKDCIKHDKVRIVADDIEVSLKDLGLIRLLGLIQTAESAAKGFGFTLTDLHVDFDEAISNLENIGRNFLSDVIKKIKFQESGGNIFNRIQGRIKPHLASIEVHVTLGLTNDLFNQLSMLSEKDIRLMSRYGLPVK
jgi:hypothetical protein